MIHLDTNVLVALPLWAKSGHPLISRVQSGERLGASTIAWFEYCNGPLSEGHMAFCRSLINEDLDPFDEGTALIASRLFNATGRRRSLKSDACIAATAIRAGAEFATLNGPDFEPFVPLGLRLLALSP